MIGKIMEVFKHSKDNFKLHFKLQLNFFNIVEL